MRRSNGNADQVARLRHQLGLSQQAFAELLGLSVVSISRWERGTTTLTDNSVALVGLLSRALSRRSPEEIVHRLREVMPQGEVERVVALVHLGD